MSGQRKTSSGVSEVVLDGNALATQWRLYIVSRSVTSARSIGGRPCNCIASGAPPSKSTIATRRRGSARLAIARCPSQGGVARTAIVAEMHQDWRLREATWALLKQESVRLLFISSCCKQSWAILNGYCRLRFLVYTCHKDGICMSELLQHFNDMYTVRPSLVIVWPNSRWSDIMSEQS